jgi:hypothetical protein
MVFQRRLIVGLLIAGLSMLGIKSMLGQGGDQSPDLGALSDADLKTVKIQLERTGFSEVARHIRSPFMVTGAWSTTAKAMSKKRERGMGE